MRFLFVLILLPSLLSFNAFARVDWQHSDLKNVAGVTFGANEFVAVLRDGAIHTSKHGVAWKRKSKLTSIKTEDFIIGITYIKDRYYVMVSDSDDRSATSTKIYGSADLMSWKELARLGAWKSKITHLNNTFFITGPHEICADNEIGRAMKCASTGSVYTAGKIVYAKGKYFAAGGKWDREKNASFPVILSSVGDGKWEENILPEAKGVELSNISLDNEEIIVVGSGGSVFELSVKQLTTYPQSKKWKKIDAGRNDYITDILQNQGVTLISGKGFGVSKREDKEGSWVNSMSGSYISSMVYGNGVYVAIDGGRLIYAK